MRIAVNLILFAFNLALYRSYHSPISLIACAVSAFTVITLVFKQINDRG
ncbi:hypothetical protein UFOVP244_38 [uncultured Caudovirales phage]|uniref:Uncharacterized protein n=1 Tax=uncultured Caudovirales phage TaxID=2100421 RepID=A0A6J7WS10_9CAUD|nr:hypothetical protein UFOVP244_38 [uncultured Caudovirales phage]